MKTQTRAHNQLSFLQAGLDLLTLQRFLERWGLPTHIS